jgi:glycosyltransferase involved in cell wall biosynthesis
MKSILWIGVIINTEQIKNHKVVSAAANNWQQRFVNALIDNGVQVNCITYLPDSYWPKGSFRPKLKKKDLPENFRAFPVSYFNIPFFREISLATSLIVTIIKLKLHFDLLITYNPFKRHIYCGTLFKSILKKKWALIIADGDKDGNPDVDIYLSNDTFLRQEGKKILMQGGVSEFKEPFYRPSNKKIILFTGNISKLTGIVEFATLFNEISNCNFELHIYGKGNDQSLNNLSLTNSKIKVFGFVNDKNLENAMRSAWIYVNPRSLAEESVQNTFPSKILEYLRYGKPILSTKTSGIGNKYDNFLFYYKAEDLQSLQNTLVFLNQLSDESYAKIHNDAKVFCSKNSWINVTKSFLYDLKNLIN